VDETHQLIIEHEVTNDRPCASDGDRYPAKETLGVEELEVLADRGYGGGFRAGGREVYG
jgi:hypothetical protein